MMYRERTGEHCRVFYHPTVCRLARAGKYVPPTLIRITTLRHQLVTHRQDSCVSLVSVVQRGIAPRSTRGFGKKRSHRFGVPSLQEKACDWLLCLPTLHLCRFAPSVVRRMLTVCLLVVAFFVSLLLRCCLDSQYLRLSALLPTQ